MSPVLEALLADCPAGGTVVDLVIGRRWTLSVVEIGGKIRGGLASPPGALTAAPGMPLGGREARAAAALAGDDDPGSAAAGLATLNALLEPDPAALLEIDAADWLAARGRGRRVAIFGRFPFIDAEIRPAAAAISVFELDPGPGEFGPADMADVLPRAELVAITASALVNHTLDGILAHIAPEAERVMLGATTPLSPRLFDFGFSLLAGVQVVDVEATVVEIRAGLSFRQMTGLRRVSLRREPL